MPNLLYDGNTNTGGTAPVDGSSPYLEGATVTVLGLGDLVKTGYRFIDWNTAADGSGTNYDESDTFLMPATDVTLYAQWAAEYALTYDGNGNTGGTATVDPSSPYLEGDTVTVLGYSDLEKTGNLFTGWNTASDGSGTSYAIDDTFAMPAEAVTLYAQWALYYTVTYDGNENTGGTVPTDSTQYLDAAEVTVLANTGSLVKTDFVFKGWNTAANGTGTHYDPADTFAIAAANVTLYAEWAAVYSVTYDGNTNTGGTVPTDATLYETGATVTVLGNTGSLVKTGNVFGGWNTAADGSGTTYAPGATFAIDGADVTLYAIWTDIPDNTVTTKAINASTFTAKRVVTADDVTNGAIVFDFQTLRDLAAVVTVVTDAGVVSVADIAVSYPAAGKVRVSGVGLVEDYVVSVFAAINSLDPVYKYS